MSRGAGQAWEEAGDTGHGQRRRAGLRAVVGAGRGTPCFPRLARPLRGQRTTRAASARSVAVAARAYRRWPAPLASPPRYPKDVAGGFALAVRRSGLDVL